MTVFSILRRDYHLLAFIILGVSGIGVTSWMYHLEQLDDRTEQEQVELIQKKLDSLLLQTSHVGATVTELATKPSARPLKFDACNGADVVNALRASGISIKPQEFEARCAADRKTQSQ